MPVVHIGTRPTRKGEYEARRNSLLYEVIARKYMREFIVITNRIGDGPKEIADDATTIAAGCAIGATYQCGNDSDLLATCVHLSFKETDNPYIWYVDATYDTDRIVSAVTDNPLNQPPVIEWDGAKYERPLVRDYLGIPVVNSSREYFDPPLTAEETRPIVRITRNEVDFDASLAVVWQDAVNSETFAGVSPGYAKINYIRGSRQISNGVIFWSVTYEIEFRREGFWLYVLDQGFRDADRRLFRDPRDATPLSNPTLLNGRGRRLSDAGTVLGAAMTNVTTTMTLADGDVKLLFPPGPSDGTPHTYFNVKVDDEIMAVIGGFDEGATDTWTVVRGQNGTTAAAHADFSPVDLEPYFLRFRPAKWLDFDPLDLPSI